MEETLITVAADVAARFRRNGAIHVAHMLARGWRGQPYTTSFDEASRQYVQRWDTGECAQWSRGEMSRSEGEWHDLIAAELERRDEAARAARRQRLVEPLEKRLAVLSHKTGRHARQERLILNYRLFELRQEGL